MTRLHILAALCTAGLVWALWPTTIPAFNNRIVLIRHGEKGPQLAEAWPPHGPDGRRKFPSGLNDDGRQRAQYLRTLFGNQSEFDFGLILAAPRDLPIETERTYATVAPLAADLGLDIDIACADTGASCVSQVVSAFAKRSSDDILIAWKHRDLVSIATALGANNARRGYPDERNDVIWIMQDGAIVEKRSMHCPGLDDGRVDEGDWDLEVEGPQVVWGWILSSWRAFRGLV